MIITIIVIALPCHAVEAVDVERATVVTDGGTLELVGGCWLSDGRCVDVARELVTLRAENAKLREAPPIGTLAGVALVSLGLGLILGAVVVYQVRK